MSYVFKPIDKSSTIVESNLVNYTQNLNTASSGVQLLEILSGSTNNKYRQSLHVLFFTSGSPVYCTDSYETNKFNSPLANISIKRKQKNQFVNKFHGYPTSSLITIPSQYYGEKIKESSFEFTDLNNSDNNGNNPIIKDDGFGNLYATNANSNFGTLTGSNTSISSSENYVGNIFYDLGLVLITETGSWSGSINYSDLGTNYNLKFDSVNRINTYEYDVNILPTEFNNTTNYTVRNVLSGSTKPLTLSTPWLASTFTSSDFQPYITTINLYQDGNMEEPVIQATLPKPIRKSDKVNLRFKIKLDI